LGRRGDGLPFKGGQDTSGPSLFYCILIFFNKLDLQNFGECLILSIRQAYFHINLVSLYRTRV